MLKHLAATALLLGSAVASATPIVQSTAFDFALTEQTVDGPRASFISRSDTTTLSFDRYSGPNPLESVTLSIDSSLWHNTLGVGTVTNTIGQLRTIFGGIGGATTSLSVGVQVDGSATLLRAGDNNTVECSDTYRIFGGQTGSCESLVKQSPVTFQVNPLLPPVTIDGSIDHIATATLTGSAIDAFLGTGLVELDLRQSLTTSDFICLGDVQLDPTCSVTSDSRWFGDFTVTYTTSAAAVPAPTTGLLLALGLLATRPRRRSCASPAAGRRARFSPIQGLTTRRRNRLENRLDTHQNATCLRR